MCKRDHTQQIKTVSFRLFVWISHPTKLVWLTLIQVPSNSYLCGKNLQEIVNLKQKEGIVKMCSICKAVSVKLQSNVWFGIDPWMYVLGLITTYHHYLCIATTQTNLSQYNTPDCMSGKLNHNLLLVTVRTDIYILTSYFNTVYNYPQVCV